MISGFLNLYKSVGWTSHDCVAKARRLLQQKRVGHGGTLDPAATGVLPIALGQATRLLQFLPGDKAYRAVIRFGLTTTTDDLEGKVVTAKPVLDLDKEAAIALLPKFLGTIAQIPPRYSAIQVQGQRLYDLARQGKDDIDIPVRTVTVHRITPLAWCPGDFPELTLEIACGTGTYIRAIARDWGALLGTGATLASLERTHSSGFDLDTALTLEQLAEQLTAGTYQALPPAIALHHLPVITLSAEAARRWQHGQKIPYEGKILEAPAYRVQDATETFLGITEWQPEPETDETVNTIRLLPKVVFTNR